MTTTEKAISAEAYEQLCNTLNEVATNMKSIKAILSDAIPGGTYDHRCASIELMANHSGALIDGMAATLGEVPVAGNLQEWFDDH